MTIPQIIFPRHILPIAGLTRVEIFLRYHLCGTHHCVMSGLICICIFYRSHHQKLILLWKQFSLTTGTAHLVKSHCSVFRELRPLVLKKSSLLPCPGSSKGDLKSGHITLPHNDGSKDTNQLSQARDANRWAQIHTQWASIHSHSTAFWGTTAQAQVHHS